MTSSLSPPVPKTFSGIRGSVEILLNLKMKWWNSAFNAQGSRVIIKLVQVGASKNVCSRSGGAQGKRKERMKLNLSPKLVVSLGPSFFF
jgi:hypothetical protein